MKPPTGAGTMHTSIESYPPLPELRVLHLVVSFAPGGRRDAILTLARAGREQKITPFLATLRVGDQDAEPFEPDFDSIQCLGIDGLPRPGQLLKLRDWCRNNGIQVVHAHDAASQFVASMLRIVAPTQHIVMTFHRSLGFESAGWRNKVRNGISLLAVDRVLTASSERRNHFIAENMVPRSKVEVIPLGIDLDRFTPDSAARQAIRAEFDLDPGELLVVSAGHYGREKGLDQALATTARAAQLLGPGCLLRHLLLGTGSAEQVAAIRASSDLDGPRMVTLAGQRSDPERWFAAADLLLHTPRMEAFGLVLVQAMACGAPVVATRVGGIPDIVVDGSTGLLAPDGDVESLARAVARLLDDPEERRGMAESALARAQTEFGSALFARRHRQLYDAILAGRSTGRIRRNPG